MADRAVPQASDLSGGPGCQACCPRLRRQLRAPDASDRIAPSRWATKPRAQLSPRPAAAIVGVEGPFLILHQIFTLVPAGGLGFLTAVRPPAGDSVVPPSPE